MRASRILTLAWLVVLVLTGCGTGDDEGDVSGTPPAEEPEPTPELTMTLELEEPLRSGGRVVWRLDVTNEGDGDATLRFPDGRSGDVVLTQEGEEVYRWSEDRAFTQAIRDETIAAGATVSYELEEPNLDVEPGEYEATATLAAEPAPPPVETTVEIEG